MQLLQRFILLILVSFVWWQPRCLIILIDWLNVTIWFKRCTLLEKKDLLKVKMPRKVKNQFKHMRRLISVDWCELTTQNMKNIKNFSCPRESDISTITHSAKYCLIIVIEKIPQNIKISYGNIIFFQYRTHLLSVSISHVIHSHTNTCTTHFDLEMCNLIIDSFLAFSILNIIMNECLLNMGWMKLCIHLFINHDFQPWKVLLFIIYKAKCTS